VSGFWPARAIPAVLAGPVAGVLLDRLDRRRIMISSDVVRAAVALAFVAATPEALKPSAAPPPTPSSQKPKPEIGFVPE
jgi:MFS family permease